MYVRKIPIRSAASSCVNPWSARSSLTRRAARASDQVCASQLHGCCVYRPLTALSSKHNRTHTNSDTSQNAGLGNASGGWADRAASDRHQLTAVPSLGYIAARAAPAASAPCSGIQLRFRPTFLNQLDQIVPGRSWLSGPSHGASASQSAMRPLAAISGWRSRERACPPTTHQRQAFGCATCRPASFGGGQFTFAFFAP